MKDKIKQGEKLLLHIKAKLDDKMQVKDIATVTLRDVKTGEILDQEFSDLIVNVGKQLVAHRIGGTGGPPNAISHMGIGTGSTPASNTDTALETQVDRNTTTNSNITTNTEGDTMRCEATWTTGEPAGQPHTLREVGLFNASSGGTMLNRIVFGAITKTSDVELTIRIDIIFS